MGWGDDLKKLTKTLITLQDKFETVDNRLDKLEKCCEDMHKEFYRLSADVEHIPTKVENLLLKKEKEIINELESKSGKVIEQTS
jgi:archaellum component FlaC